MKKLNPDKLQAEYRIGVTPTHPVIGRKYTLTHSDITAELFLTVALEYAYDKIGPMRDEVLAEFKFHQCRDVFHVYCYIGGAADYQMAQLRYHIFKNELPLALQAIRYGDAMFFKCHPSLDYCPIFVYFDSIYPDLNTVESFGSLSQYRLI
ncbi:MAG TPA: staygreen family protein [Bacillus sp. (in: firmicutes)]|nr:staygreen family protein [Bacillus sp. (in: firmicutes)]